MSLSVRVQVTGTAPTVVRARVWRTGQAEPTTWQVSATDATAGLQVAGAVGVGLYGVAQSHQRTGHGPRHAFAADRTNSYGLNWRNTGLMRHNGASTTRTSDGSLGKASPSIEGGVR